MWGHQFESYTCCLFFQVGVRNQHLVNRAVKTLYHIYDVAFLSSSSSPPTNVSYISAETRPRRYKCGLSAPCPPKHLAFRLVSGAANVIGPKICLEDKMWDWVPIPLCSFMFSVPCCFLCSFLLFWVWFTLCCFFPLCCHNQAFMSVWGSECKYSFSLSVRHLFVFVFFCLSSFCISCCFLSARMCRCVD